MGSLPSEEFQERWFKKAWKFMREFVVDLKSEIISAGEYDLAKVALITTCICFEFLNKVALMTQKIVHEAYEKALREMGENV